MRNTHYVVFEVCRECNLSLKHSGKCPNGSKERYAGVDTSRELSDEKIVEIAVECYEKHGFRGMIGWHYYNEPLVARDRMIRLCREIVQRVPKARFVLWTNGELLRPGDKEIGIFHRVYLSSYSGMDFGFVRELVPEVIMRYPVLDGRLGLEGQGSLDRCRRMFGEMIFDFYGNVRICCMDWRGKVQIGNAYGVPLEELISRFVGVRRSMMNGMSDMTPEACRACGFRDVHVPALVPWVMEDVEVYLKKNPGVVP